MIGKTRYAENLILNFLFTGGALVPPATWYVGLFTAAPTDTSAGTEVAGGSYARQAITADDSHFLESTLGETENLTDIIFPEASASWGSVVAVGIFDALSGGNLWFAELLTTPQTVATGNQPSFVAGQLQIAEE